MSDKARRALEFPSFAVSLRKLSHDQMLRQVEEEIKELCKLSVDDPMSKFRQMSYERKLHRLESSLRTGRLPSNLTPKERTAYGVFSG